MDSSIPKSILDSYPIGKVRRVRVIRAGLIHRTFELTADAGRFILQRLHPMLATPGIAEDFEAVTVHLRSKGFLAPELVKTVGGKRLAGRGTAKWRLQTRIPGTAYDTVGTAKRAREAGAVFARFHGALADLPHAFKSAKVLHDTERIYAEFARVLDRHRDSAPYAAVEADARFLEHELPKRFLPADLPQWVIHGDPKVSNILFDRNGRAVSIIDLDTCNRRSVLVELGDAFRSWCGAREDDPRNRFDLVRFRAGWEGYRDAIGARLTARERRLVPRAVGTITLELAARFLKDYFEDAYFGWDADRYESRRAHNLARVKGQIALYRDLMEKSDRIRSICR